MNILEPGIYRHYKGNFYELIGTARHSETEEEYAVYKALSKPEGENLWIRPLKMFRENVVLNGTAVPRFSYVGKDLRD